MIKKLIVLSATIVASFSTAKQAPNQQSLGQLEIDKIVAIIDGPSSTDVLTLSDIQRRGFDGQKHDLQTLISECAGKQHSEVLGIPVEDEDVLRYLRAVAQAQQQEPTVTAEALKATAENAGFETTAEFYDMLKRIYGANAAMNMQVSSLATVSEQEARAYDEANQLYKPATYILQTVFIPYDKSMNTEEQKAQLQEIAKTNKVLGWSIAFDIAEPDIAPDKQFIKTLKPNDAHVSEVAQGFELYRLKHYTPQQRISFDERKKEIIAKLREEKFNKAIARYQQDRLDDVHVTTF